MVTSKFQKTMVTSKCQKTMGTEESKMSKCQSVKKTMVIEEIVIWQFICQIVKQISFKATKLRETSGSSAKNN